MNDLNKFVLAAKAILFDAKRAAPLLAMLATKSGAITAVHSVMAVIERKRPIPPAISPQLAIAILNIMVELAQDATGTKLPPTLIAQVTKEMQSEVVRQQPQQQVRQPAGLINQGA